MTHCEPPLIWNCLISRLNSGSLQLEGAATIFLVEMKPLYIEQRNSLRLIKY